MKIDEVITKNHSKVQMLYQTWMVASNLFLSFCSVWSEQITSCLNILFHTTQCRVDCYCHRGHAAGPCGPHPAYFEQNPKSKMKPLCFTSFWPWWPWSRSFGFSESSCKKCEIFTRSLTTKVKTVLVYFYIRKKFKVLNLCTPNWDGAHLCQVRCAPGALGKI